MRRSGPAIYPPRVTDVTTSRTPANAMRHHPNGHSRLRRYAFPVALAVTLISCVRFTKVGLREMDVSSTAPPVLVSSPMKAHLKDGATVVFPRGAAISRGGITGSGTRYGLFPVTTQAVLAIPLDSVVGVETYETKTQMVPTVLVSAVATVAASVVVAGLAKALFGSCPTFYSDSAGVAVLEAEGFSYSIAPLFEARDLDRLRATAGADGRLQLEVRNEALETHYINLLELVEARHAPGEFALPDEHGSVLAVGALSPVSRATDRAGRDVGPELRAADGRVFATDSRTLAAVHEGDMEDYIDLTLPPPATGDSVALVLRLRNSLLNTVLLYDGMLGGGPQALDWMARDLNDLSTAVTLGLWYKSRMGMRIAVRGDSGFRAVSYIADTGPIAFHDVAVVLPVPSGRPPGDSVRVRLSFAADQWRIDRVAVAASFHRPHLRSIAIGKVSRDDGSADAEAHASLRAADKAYLVTSPGQRFHLSFDVGTIAPDSARTFMLASQGYYTEWVRGSWLASAGPPKPFAPSDRALLAALHLWASKQESFEQQFYASRLPVR